MRGLQSREVKETVHQALQKLSPDLARGAVILRDLQDMDYKEIATWFSGFRKEP